MTDAEAPILNGARMLARLDELAAVGATASGGVTRLAYSPEDIVGRNLVAGWLREAGLAPSVDAAGNLLAMWPGRVGPGALVTGSHLDTVIEAGKLDGAYGVVAAVEAAAALTAAGVRLRHDLVIAAWSNEEGARGTPGMVGSHCAAGNFDPEELQAEDRGGVSLRQRIIDAGGDPDRVSSAAWTPGRLAALIELHVEQGPVLDAAGVTIGAVSAITGQLIADMVITGVANHAGSTPMDLRNDALAAAAEVVLAIERLALEGAVRVATAGSIEVSPGVRNAIPGRVLLSVDLRDADDRRLAAAWQQLQETGAEIAHRRGVQVTGHANSRVPAVAADPVLVQIIEQACVSGGLTSMRLPSGAGHDAQVLAALGPISMIFVPSSGGVSHSPAESTSPEHLVAGARILLATVLAADGVFDCAGTD